MNITFDKREVYYVKQARYKYGSELYSAVSRKNGEHMLNL